MHKKNHAIQMIKLQFLRSSGPFIFFIPMLAIISLGMAIGYTFLFADIDPGTLLYLATGAPTVLLIVAGLTVLPQQNAQAKATGYTEFLRTLPTKRINIMMADILIWLAIILPGFFISTFVTHLVFAPGYAVSLTVIPSFLLVGITSIAIGYGYSFALPVHVTSMLGSILTFGALMFSPINFPMEHLPNWLQVVHRILPLHAMANAMRASLASTTYTADTWDYVKLMIWCVAGLVLSISILNRKKG